MIFILKESEISAVEIPNIKTISIKEHIISTLDISQKRTQHRLLWRMP